MKTKVWRKKGSVGRDDLPWLPESKGLDTGSSTWELRTLAIKKWLLLAEMSITRTSFIQHIVEIYKEKQDQKLVPIYKFKLIC